MTYQIPLSNELIVDNFAGGGGASIGIEMALQRPVNIAINHDPRAVAMHKMNHPNTQHYCEDVWEVDPKKVIKGKKIALAWFSPDCKHFSKAKGGALVDKKIRGLAWVVLRWASLPKENKPRVIMLENVEEFQTWGPVKNGKPCKKRKGQTFDLWVSHLRALGYKVEWRELRACDYGAPTIRKRLFLIARCDGRPIVWPEPTHGPEGSGLLPYRTAAECIDWSIPCPSIFERKRPLAENTMKRIAKGLKRFVFDAQEPFIVPTGYGERKRQAPRVNSLLDPLNTVVGTPKHNLVIPKLTKCSKEALPKYKCLSCGEEFNDEFGTAIGGLAPVECCKCGEEERIEIAPFLTEHANGSTQRVFDPQEPLRTQCAQVKGGHFALVQAFLAKHFGGVTGVEVDKPLPTILSKASQTQLVTSHIMKMRGHSGRDKHGHSMDEPLHTISASGTHHAEVRAFLLKYYGSGDGKEPHELTKSLGTITSKDRFGIVTVHGVDYQIVDICMRMLAPKELYKAQSFPDDYIFDRGDFDGEIKPLPKTAQVQMVGNSVPPFMSYSLAKANVPQTEMLLEAAE